MNRFACALLGENRTLLEKCGTASSKKVTTLALLLILPVGLWFVAAFLGSKLMFNITNLQACGIASAAAFLIYILDRSIVSVCGNNWLTRIRMGLAIISGILNAAFLDAAIFESDFRPIAEEKQLQQGQETFNTENTLLHSEISTLQTQEAAAIADLKGKEEVLMQELNGSGGSGKSGYGKIAKMKEASRDLAQENLDMIRSNLSAKKATLTEKNEAFISNQKGAALGFLISLESLHALLAENHTALLVWALFTLLLITMEFLPVLVKKLTSKTAYEALLERNDRKIQSEIEMQLYLQQLRESRITNHGQMNADAIQWLEEKARMN